MSHLMIYLILKLDTIGCIAYIVPFLLFIGCICYCCLMTEEIPCMYDRDSKFINEITERNKKLEKIFFRATILYMCSILIAISIPTTNQMAMIYIIPKITNNHELQQLPPKLLKIANNYLDKEMKNETN